MAENSSTPAPGSKFEIQMLHDRVLVRRSGDDGERHSSGGLVIPATAEVAHRLAWGEVLGTGNNVRHVKLTNHVLFNPEDQMEVEIQGEIHLVIRERDIHAVATESTEHGTGLYL